jgi:hypothetical protein
VYSRHPRLRGVAIIAGAATCAAINVATIRVQHQYRTLLFPFALGVLPAGVVVLVTGWSPGQRMGKQVARLMLALMLVGIVAGFALNWWIGR